MKKTEVINLIENLKRVFEIVRLVDVPQAKCFYAEGDEFSKPTTCYSVWGKDARCENCISADAFTQKKRLSKFEFTQDEVYFVQSQYVEVDGTPYALEMVNKIEDRSLFGAYGKNEFSKTIQHHTSQVYLDPLTGAYNRLYYTEQLNFIVSHFSLAMVDLDNFKPINDEYGHLVGDLALIKTVKAFKKYIRGSEAIVRFGGDEFLLVLNRTSKDELFKRLDEMRFAINSISFDDYPKLRLSVSIGGIADYHADSIQKIDGLMYKAKEKRNQVIVE